MMSRLQGLDPTLYFVTDTALCTQVGRSVAETAAAAVRGGAGLVQVRDKQLDDADFYRLSLQVLQAVNAAAPVGRRIAVVLNDRVAVAQRLRQQGHEVHIHVGQDDTPVQAVRAQLGPQVLIGLSAAAADEFAAARASACVDLLGIGSPFATTTKDDARQVLGVAGLSALVSEAGLPAVAIGGIQIDNAVSLRDSGVIGICVVSAICSASDPQMAANTLYEAFRGKPFAGATA